MPGPYERTPEHIVAMLQGRFFEAVSAEREYQRQRWGDEHDDGHEAGEWGLVVTHEVGQLADLLLQSLGLDRWEDDDPELCLEPIRAQAIKVAATCNALVDSIDRAIERYEGDES